MAVFVFFFTFIEECCVVIGKNINKKLVNRISRQIWYKRCLKGKFGRGVQICEGVSKSAGGPDPLWHRVCPVDFDGRREMSSLLLKTVVVHKSVTSLMMETNLRKGGLVHRVPWTKSREKLQELFQSVACCFVNINTVTYFNLFFNLNVNHREGAFRSPLSTL